MFTIKSKSKSPCFVTGVTERCVIVKFKDNTFNGSISLDALYERLPEEEAKKNSKEKARVHAAPPLEVRKPPVTERKIG